VVVDVVVAPIVGAAEVELVAATDDGGKVAVAVVDLIVLCPDLQPSEQ